MEFSIEAVSKRVIIVIIALSALIIIGGGIFHRSSNAIFFAVGVLVSMGINIVRVIWLRQSVIKAVAMEDSASASNHIRIHRLLRFLFAFVILLGMHLIFGSEVMLWGAVFSIFTLTIAMHSMHFFVRNSSNNDKVIEESESKENN